VLLQKGTFFRAQLLGPHMGLGENLVNHVIERRGAVPPSFFTHETLLKSRSGGRAHR
jgi:hypothetical protein